DEERSKESAYVLEGFLACPFVSFVSHIARYAPFSTDKSSSLRNQKSTQPNFRTPLVGQQIFLRVFHHGCRRSAYPCFVFSATQNPSVNPKNYDENGDFCIFPPDEPKTTMKTAIFAFSRSTLHSRFPRS
ncbi:MAG: hypothetical protein MR980_05950, partial [Bacteroidales bacterium]|nr:hypothetical protein [Bacteroidales bacterium]